MLEAYHALRYPRSTLVPLILWVLTLLSLPVLGWILGEPALLRGMSVGVLVQAGAVLMILIQAWGWRRTVRVSGLLALLSYLAELLGSHTGFPFGKYYYTDLLQPQLAGVPLLIPLAWLMMLAPAWAVAELIWPRPVSSGRAAALPHALLAALAFTAWDLFLDPQMVRWGFWVWEQPGQYFGIPLVNYLGWLIISALITWILNPQDLPLGPLALVYTLTWLLQTVGQALFWEQPGPALAGFVGSGLFVLLAWRASLLPRQASR